MKAHVGPTSSKITESRKKAHLPRLKGAGTEWGFEERGEHLGSVFMQIGGGSYQGLTEGPPEAKLSSAGLCVLAKLSSVTQGLSCRGRR